MTIISCYFIKRNCSVFRYNNFAPIFHSFLVSHTCVSRTSDALFQRFAPWRCKRVSRAEERTTNFSGVAS